MIPGLFPADVPVKKYRVQGRPLPKTTSPGIIGIMVRFKPRQPD